MKRMLSLVLSLAMVLTCVPAQVFATEVCDHSYDAVVTEAGCVEEGSVVYTCTLCGDSYEETLAAAGHNYVQTSSVEAACGVPGSVTYACDACGDSYTEEIPAGEHTYEAGVCTICGGADPDAVPPTEAPEPEIAEGEAATAAEVPAEAPAEPAYLASGTCGDNLTWTLDHEGTFTISGTGAMKDYSYGNAPWHGHRSSIQTVIVEVGVTGIGIYAFYDCDNLTSITLPEGIASIGNYAFQNCSSLSSITLPESLTEIHYSAFYNCSNLGDVYITNIAAWAEGYGNTDSHPLNRNQTINLYLDGEPIEDLVIPAGVTYIAYGAFCNCGNLTSVTIPEGVTSIGGYAFYNCSSLADIVIPEGVTSIGGYAFQNCSSLSSIVLPESLTEVADDAFYYCSNLTDIYITNIASWAENYGNPDSSHPVNRDNGQQINLYLDELPVTNLVIPEGVTHIGYGAFRNVTSLRRVTLPSSVTTIDGFAFYNCSGMTKLTLAEGLTTIGNRAFYGCASLRDVVIPEGVTSIEYYAFYECIELETVALPSSLTTIAEGAFGNCRRLESIDLPAGITEIEGSTFGGCSNLESVTLPDTLTTIGNSAFSGCSILPVIDLPDSVTTIGYSAFSGCEGLTSITIPEGVTSIGNSVFYGCDNLSTVVLPDSLVSIGTHAFYNSGITTITIPKGIAYLEDSTFGYCNYLETVNLPDGLLEIGTYAFHGCRSLKSITLPDSITDIGNYAFYGCDGLVSIVLPAGLTRLEENVFYYCTSLESVTLPQKLARIYKNAFQSCVKLTSIEFPASLTRLDANIFSGCSKLTDITFNGNAPQFHASTFTGVTADAVYPASNATWTSDKLQDYGGTINWISSDDLVTPDPSDPADMVTVYITLYLDGKLVDNKPVSVPVGTMMDASAVKDYASQQLYPEYFTEDYVYVSVEGGGLAEDISSVRIYFETKSTPTEPVCDHMIRAWTPNGDGTHSASCYCGLEKHLQACSFGSDNVCSVCGGKAPANPAIDYRIEVRVDGVAQFSKEFIVNNLPDEEAIVAYAKADGDISAYFSAYASYSVVDWTQSSAAIDFTNGSAPAPTDPMPTVPPETTDPLPTDPSEEPTDPVATYELTFKYRSSSWAYASWTTKVLAVQEGDVINVPTVPTVSGYIHTGWDNDLQPGVTRWYVGMPTTYTATYVTSTVDLTVYADYYVDGAYQKQIQLFTQSITRDSDLSAWLYANGINQVTSKLNTQLGADGYQWKPAAFYNYDDGSEISATDPLIADDARSVYVKIDAEPDAFKADVRVHIHTAKESTIERTIKLCDYTLGDKVTRDAVLLQVGKYYTGAEMTMTMYTAANWDKLLNNSGSSWPGQTAASTSSVTLETTDTTELHVLLTNAEPTTTITGTVNTVGTLLNVRNTPSTAGAVVTQLEPGTKVAILQTQTVMGVDWGLIAEGWVIMTYIDLDDAPEDNICGDNLTWSFDKSTGTLTISGTGDMYDYGIGGMPWVAYKDEIQSVVIKEATYVGAYAFYDLPNLKQVTIPLSVAAMGDQAFSDSPVETAFYAGAPSQWEEITQNNSGPWNCTVRCEKPGKNLFWYLDEKGQLVICGSGEMDDFATPTMPVPWEDIKGQIQQVWIKEDVTSIGTIAFRDCPQLTAVTVLKGVKDIALGAFGGENKLQSITVDAENAYYTSEDGVLFNKDKTVLLQYPSQRKSGYYSIPEGVTEIATGAFENCDNLSSVGFPASLKTIGHFAFMDSDGLKQIRIRDNITEIGNSAFVNCTGLQTVAIGSGVKDLGICVFSGCTSLTEVELPDTLVNIWECVFQDCTSLKRIVLPAGLNFISDATFSGCTGLEEIVIGGVQEIYWAFENCAALQNVYFRGDAPTYSTDAFQTLTLNAYYPAENATWTEEVRQSFGGNITWIPVATSGDCGDSVTWSYDANTRTLIISGNGDMADYPDSAPWAVYGKEIVNLVIENGVTGIGDFAFRDCEALYHATFPESLVRIGESAFPKVEWSSGDGTTEIYDLIFWSEIDQTVRQWSTVQMEKGSVGFLAWDNTTFRNDAPIVASGVFGASAYWELDEDGTATIFGTGDTYEFWATGSQLGNYPVTSIVIDEGVTGINLNAFEGITTVESVTVASTVKTVETMVFADCQSLNTIIFLGDAPAFGADCFRNVTATAIYPADKAGWTADVLQDYEGNITWIPAGAAKNRVVVSLEELDGQTALWIDGKEYAAQIDGEYAYVDLPDGKAKTLVTYTYHVGDASDVHTQYPVSMNVWMLTNTNGYYSADRTEVFDDILQYSGMSIRVFGKKGIRMITSIEQEKKDALVSCGLEGYSLKEYGTVIAWASQISANKPLVLGASYVSSNYAYKQGIADPVFKYTGNMMQYTNVLVNFTNDQCKDDLAMRPYMILEDGNGEQVTIYGGVLRRNIGYIAVQNRKDVFEPGSDAYEYIWEIIRYVYGTQYDKDYVVSWSPPAM